MFNLIFKLLYSVFYSIISLVSFINLIYCSPNMKNILISDEAKSAGFTYVSDYVDDAVIDLRYFSSYNFVGTRIDGYLAPRPMMTKEAAIALASAAADLRKQGYRIIIYDTYRPKKAVQHFIRWFKDDNLPGMKESFFPNCDKKILFDKGFISRRSRHSSGSTIDLGLVTMDSKLVDMGGAFDFFDDISHSDYQNISDEQKKNRKILKDAMLKNGFKGIKSEWWHFTLKNEPYPNTYFDFDVK